MSVGHEELVGDVLVTRVRRKPPMWTLEHAADDGSISKAMMTKKPKGVPRGWYVQVSPDLGYEAPTRRKAIEAFAGMSNLAANQREEEEGVVL